MRLPLLIGGRPRLIREGAKVPLGWGEWVITSNHNNSKVRLIHGDKITPLNALVKLSIFGPLVVQIIIIECGSEDSIDVYAEKVA